VYEVFDSARHLLWRTRTETWAWVLGAAGTRTPADIRTLRGYLGFHAPPPDWIAHHLIARGAGLDALATCCRLLGELSDDAQAEDVEAAIDLLLAAPHCLDFTQLGPAASICDGPIGWIGSCRCWSAMISVQRATLLRSRPAMASVTPIAWTRG